MAISNIDIIVKLLTFCVEPKPKDQILVKVNLNDPFVNSYLSICTSQELLSLKTERSYITTEKGKHFLRIYARFSEIVKGAPYSTKSLTA